MSSMKKVFENETKIRINLMGSSKSEKSALIFDMAIPGVFTKQNNIKSDIFPTEVLYSSPRYNYAKVYLDFEEKDEVLSRMKRIIFNLIDEAFMEELKENEMKNEKFKFYRRFGSIAEEKIEIPLTRLFNVSKISDVFKDINFNRLFSDLSKINRNDNLEEKDELIWKVYFNEFEYRLNRIYDEWMTKLSECYIHHDEGCIYENEYDNNEKFFNSDFKQLLTIIYDGKDSCGLIMNRAYIEVPAVKDEYTKSIFIDYNNKNINRSIASDIMDRAGEDSKELFILVGNCSDENSELLKIKDLVSKSTLENRVFCILNKVKLYINNVKNRKIEIINEIKNRTSKYLGINENRIIITDKFMDIDKNTLEILPSNEDFIKLLNIIKKQSQHLIKPIKIRNSSKDNIINISLNQERMSVQALVHMLYDRYNGYLVDLWRDIIKHEKEDDKRKKYYYNCVRNIIKNRKDDFKEFRCEKKGFINYNKAIDFSITHGDYNDSKKIVKMLVNYGYHTVGFNSHENKILVTVNGEISKESKENLIKSIKERLEESAVKYFEDAFLMDVSRKKFNVNSLKSSLEVEKSITVDDFYNAFKKAFKKISENIERYDICLID